MKKKVWGCGLDYSGWGQGELVDSCEYSNELLDSISGEFRNYLRILIPSQEGSCSMELVHVGFLTTENFIWLLNYAQHLFESIFNYE
jgi:hypothetical protein